MLIAITAIAIWQATEAARQRDAVLAEQQRTRASNEFFGGLVDQLNDQPMTSLELLDRGTALLQQQYDIDSPFMPYTLYEMARRYARLRESDKQIALLEQAAEAAARQQDFALQAAALCRLSGAVGARDSAKATRYFTEASQLYSTLSSPSLEASVDCLRMLARDAARSGDTDQALALMQEANVIAIEQSASVDVRGPVLGYIAQLYFNAERMQDAIDTLDETRALLIANGRGQSLGYLRVSANKAVTLVSVGRLPEALATWEDLIQRIRATDYEQRGSAGFLGQYAQTLARAGRIDESLPLYEEAMRVAEASGDRPSAAIADLGLARSALSLGEHDTALMHLDRIREYAADNQNAVLSVTRGAEVLRVKVYRDAGQLDRAVDALQVLLDELDYPRAEYGAQLISTIIEGAQLYQTRGEWEVAESFADQAITRVKTRAVGDPADSIDVARAYAHRAEIREARGDIAGAASDSSQALPALRKILGDDHEETIAAHALSLRVNASE